MCVDKLFCFKKFRGSPRVSFLFFVLRIFLMDEMLLAMV